MVNKVIEHGKLISFRCFSFNLISIYSLAKLADKSMQTIMIGHIRIILVIPVSTLSILVIRMLNQNQFYKIKVQPHPFLSSF